jgi:uncharacterized protein
VIISRLTTIGRRDAVDPAFDALLGVVDIVDPIEIEDVQRARRLITTNSALSARDAIHVAVMQRYGIERIATFDRAFDGISGIERLAT